MGNNNFINEVMHMWPGHNSLNYVIVRTTLIENGIAQLQWKQYALAGIDSVKILKYILNDVCLKEYHIHPIPYFFGGGGSGVCVGEG
jgi:hypothetical protein